MDSEKKERRRREDVPNPMNCLECKNIMVSEPNGISLLQEHNCPKFLGLVKKIRFNIFKNTILTNLETYLYLEMSCFHLLRLFIFLSNKIKNFHCLTDIFNNYSLFFTVDIDLIILRFTKLQSIMLHIKYAFFFSINTSIIWILG